MTVLDHTAGRPPHRWLHLVAFLFLAYAVAAIGGWATASSVQSWYPTLAKPPFNPPNWLFGPVWTVLYAMIGVAGWRLWPVASSALRSAWVAQLGLNLLWSLLFFGARMPAAALADIALMLAAILACVVLAWRRDRPASLLMIPYLCWTAFAALLNLEIVRLN